MLWGAPEVMEWLWTALRRVALPHLLETTSSRALSCRTRALLRRDKERYVRGLAEDIKFNP